MGLLNKNFITSGGGSLAGVFSASDGSQASPSLKGKEGFSTTGFFFDALPLTGRKRLNAVVDGISAVKFYPSSSQALEAGGLENTGFLNVKGTITPASGSKAGIIIDIDSLQADQTGNGSQAAARISLYGAPMNGGDIVVGTRDTYGLYVGNSTKTTAVSYGVFSFVDGGEVVNTGSGTTAGTVVAGIFSGKDSDSRTIGVCGMAHGHSNPNPLCIGSLGFAHAGTLNVAGYFGLYPFDGNTLNTPTITESVALVADNGAETSDIFQARDNGTKVFSITDGGRVGIGASPNANALLDVSSTTKAFMPPRMTTLQKNAIPSPTAGMMVYDTTLGKLAVYTTAWQTVTSA